MGNHHRKLRAGIGLCLFAATAAFAQPNAAAPPNPVYKPDYTGFKKVLFVGDLHTGAQAAHESVSHAMAVLERLARRQHIAILFRTDTRNLTLKEVWGTGDYAKGGSKQNQGENLNDFDAVVFFTNGDTEMSDSQKADFLQWIKSGKGFVGIHTATTTMLNYPPYAQMIGGTFDGHPWGYRPARVIVERPDFPGMKAFVGKPSVLDEHYQVGAPYSRADVDVLLRLDPKSVDMTRPDIHRKDGDFPVAWIKNYGKGRIFYSSFGQPIELWDDPRIQTMYLEAIKWAVGRTDYPVRPHPMKK